MSQRIIVGYRDKIDIFSINWLAGHASGAENYSIVAGKFSWS